MIITPPRFWVIYLSCLEKPRSLKEISNEIGYKGLSALYHNYKGKPLVEWMMETKNEGHPFLRLAEKKGREIKYESVLESLLPDNEIHIWKYEWIKSTVFKLDNIKILFEVRKHKEKMLERLGGEFMRFVWAVLLSKGLEIYLMKNEGDKKKANFYSFVQRDIMGISFANLNVKGYMEAIQIEKRQAEIMNLFVTHYLDFSKPPRKAK